MKRYIALLRGINVSGKNKISMSELKEYFLELGFAEVITYLNSGNVIFSSVIADKNNLSNKIMLMIKDTIMSKHLSESKLALLKRILITRKRTTWLSLALLPSFYFTITSPVSSRVSLHKGGGLLSFSSAIKISIF